MMGKRKSVKDFRSSRKLLPAEIFALGTGTRSRPTDLVRKRVWRGIMHLPDDVALRTSDHHGKQLGILYTLWGAWLDAIGEDQDALYGAMLDATDCFQSSTFDGLHGYYRSALSDLRAALDVVAIGTVGNLAPADPVYARWEASNARLVFPLPKLRRLTNEPVSSLLFKQAGWMDNLYDDLSAYSHLRPDASDGTMWESNGPVYSTSAFRKVFGSQIATYAACYHMVKVGRPDFILPKEAEMIFLAPFASDRGEQMYRTVFKLERVS
jgi:hypothetical protein